MKAIYPGSFDPPTKGHLDIIQRAARLCKVLFVAILANADKNAHFSVEERVSMVKESIQNLEGQIEVITFQGLVVELVKSLKADTLIRGMRDIGDFRYEWETASVNKAIGDVETLFLITNPKYAFMSSSRVREIAKYGGDLSAFLPEPILARYTAKGALA